MRQHTHNTGHLGYDGMAAQMVTLLRTSVLMLQAPQTWTASRPKSCGSHGLYRIAGAFENAACKWSLHRRLILSVNAEKRSH